MRAKLRASFIAMILCREPSTATRMEAPPCKVFDRLKGAFTCFFESTRMLRSRLENIVSGVGLCGRFGVWFRDGCDNGAYRLEGAAVMGCKVILPLRRVENNDMDGVLLLAAIVLRLVTVLMIAWTP